MSDEPISLHPTVQAVAKTLVLRDGRMVISETDLATHRATLSAIQGADEKRAVLVSLVALTARLMREGSRAADASIMSLMDLAAHLIGDRKAAEALFARAGVKPSI